MVLKYNKLRKYCTFCTEHIEYNGETKKCNTIYTMCAPDRKLNSHKVDFSYNQELNGWKPYSPNSKAQAFHVQGILLNSPNVGIYNWSSTARTRLRLSRLCSPAPSIPRFPHPSCSCIPTAPSSQTRKLCPCWLSNFRNPKGAAMPLLFICHPERA